MTATAIIKQAHTAGPECPLCAMDRIASAVAEVVAGLRAAGSDDAARSAAR